jgi:C4-dicarboxylate-specific signal transduction histidine kinase
LCLHIPAAATFRVDRAAKVIEILWAQYAVAISRLGNAEAYRRAQTTLAELEHALHESQATLEIAQDISRTGSYRWNPATGQDTWSKNNFRLLGYDPQKDTPSYQLFLDRVHPEDRDGWMQVAAEAIRTRGTFQYEYRLLLPDGTVRYVQSLGRHDTGDEFIGTLMDVTELRQAEAALRHSQMELARVSRVTTMGELAASIAHEVNQPLTAIVANAGASQRWLNRADPDLARLSKTLATIIADGQRAGRIVRGLQSLASKSPPEFAPLVVDELIREVLNATTSEREASGVMIRTELAAAKSFVTGSRVQLQQVVFNLIMNAVEAMSSTSKQHRILTVRSRTLQGSVEVDVEDTGVGLSEDAADRLFEPFYTTKKNGMGMGLAICRSIIEGHAGTLGTRAKGPFGTVFSFTLPERKLEASTDLSATHD